MKRLLTLLIPALLWGATATVVPDADNTSGSFVTAPLFSKVNDDIDAPNGTVITSPNNPSVAAIFDITCPSDMDTATDANLRVRARQNNVSRNITLAVSWSATAATNFSTGTLNKTAQQNYASGSIGSLSISKATCDASTLSVTPTTSGTGTAATADIDALNLDITYTVATAQPARRVISVARHSVLAMRRMQ